MAQKETGGNTGKVVLVGTLIAGGALLVARALGKGKEEPPREGPGAGVSITVFDAETGLPVPKNSPAVVTEGKRYWADFEITNRSTRGLVAIAAELQIKIDGYAGAVPFAFTDQAGNLWAKNWVSPFLANQPLIFRPYFTVPLGSAGQTSNLTLAVWTPPLGAGQLIPGAVDSEPLTIQAEAITYQATATITSVMPV